MPIIRKIAEQKDEIAERRQDLQEAKEKGDAEKIAKRERMQEAQDELKAPVSLQQISSG